MLLRFLPLPMLTTNVVIDLVRWSGIGVQIAVMVAIYNVTVASRGTRIWCCHIVAERYSHSMRWAEMNIEERALCDRVENTAATISATHNQVWTIFCTYST